MKIIFNKSQIHKIMPLMQREYWGLCKPHGPYVESKKIFHGVLFIVIRHGNDRDLFKWKNDEWQKLPRTADEWESMGLETIILELTEIPKVKK